MSLLTVILTDVYVLPRPCGPAVHGRPPTCWKTGRDYATGEGQDQVLGPRHPADKAGPTHTQVSTSSCTTEEGLLLLIFAMMRGRNLVNTSIYAILHHGTSQLSTLHLGVMTIHTLGLSE